RVIGVEISPALAEIARANLAARRHQHHCPNVEIVISDAADFDPPDDLTIGYFYYPFRGTTLDTVLRRIIESMDRRPRPVRLICVGPAKTARHQILATGRFQVLEEQRSRLLDTWTSEAVIFESR